MHLAALLVALLGVQGSPVPPGGADLVSQVRVEARDPESLERFVQIEAGRPLDPEAARRTVELIYATGRFEDVQIGRAHV